MAYTNKVIRNAKTGQALRFIQTSRDTNGQLLEMESTFRARSTKPAAHYHPIQDENFTVIAGELTVQIDGQTRTFRPGDRLHIPRNTVHSMWNASDEETVVNWQVSPALDTEFFLETAYGLANEGKTGPDGRPALLQSALLMQHFSRVFRLTSPSLLVQQLVFGLLSPLAYVVGYRPTYKKYLN
ncbi:MAG: cupin protein [Spirosoma sp.]|nr:cupin protein [Spirosoma sp.]